MTITLRFAAVGLAAGMLVLGAGTAEAAPAAAAAPSESVWIADVTTVTDQATAYLQQRLANPGRNAIVLDIDNTSLETYYHPQWTTPATPPVLELAKLAKADGAAVFFVTDRTELIRSVTADNLTDVGYPVDGLSMRPLFNFDPAQVNKTKARAAIEAQGYTIVANIGNNTTDLDGGHAERTFKLPDYNGALS
ncbi:HAD family acid phosphatase [Kutzneria buriramensis]|uniref:Putative acid phosphatase of HAD superfamily subfamily IIIB n=1 Tax=Kutzneria buriramensis TaxID=1045776 RepID=A0A3E0GX06_9PSEU|nr:HAD family acid phosphatase [Kutzneria buriramensis]REH32663.1 putative acid phosphatase of HAD superfamily subfamily IIIB [Kutzneria buriramensis]